MKRVFLGINLPQNLKIKIEKLKTENNLLNLPIKLVEPENSHIAIKFFDELNDEQIKALLDTIKGAVNGFKSFEVTIENSLIFPGLANPRVLSLKVASLNLEGLAKKIFAVLNDLKFIVPEDKKYIPHITLGRIKNKLTKNEIDKIRSLIFKDNFMVNEIHLFMSELTSSGPIYTILKTFELK